MPKYSRYHLPPPPPPPPLDGVRSSRFSFASLAFNCPKNQSVRIRPRFGRLLCARIPKWKDVFLFFCVLAICRMVSSVGSLVADVGSFGTNLILDLFDL